MQEVIVKHRVKQETVTSADKKEAADAVKALDAALKRLGAFGATRDVANAAHAPGALTRTDVDQIVAATAKGRSSVSPPHLTQALERAIALHAASADDAVIDPASGFTTQDLALLVPIARQALYDARAQAAHAKQQRVTNMVWLAIILIVVLGGVWMVIRG